MSANNVSDALRELVQQVSQVQLKAYELEVANQNQAEVIQNLNAEIQSARSTRSAVSNARPLKSCMDGVVASVRKYMTGTNHNMATMNAFEFSELRQNIQLSIDAATAVHQHNEAQKLINMAAVNELKALAANMGLNANDTQGVRVVENGVRRWAPTGNSFIADALAKLNAEDDYNEVIARLKTLQLMTVGNQFQANRVESARVDHRQEAFDKMRALCQQNPAVNAHYAITKLKRAIESGRHWSLSELANAIQTLENARVRQLSPVSKQYALTNLRVVLRELQNGNILHLTKHYDGSSIGAAISAHEMKQFEELMVHLIN